MAAGPTTQPPLEPRAGEVSSPARRQSAASAPSKMLGERASFYVWTAIVLAVAVAAVILGWHASGGTTDPTDLPPGRSLSHTTVVINSAILVFREGLETILVLAAVTASFLGANRLYRRPVALGGAAAIAASIGTWFLVIWFIGQFHGGEFDVQAATGLPVRAREPVT